MCVEGFYQTLGARAGNCGKVASINGLLPSFYQMIVTAYGTEAAAVTALTITRLSIRPSLDPVPMTVDRSFYVAILYGKHNVTEVLPLFVGVVHNV